MNNDELQKTVLQLQRDLQALTDAFYQNNFTSNQDFPKYCNFLFRLKIPHYASLPATCQQGELAETGGKLYIASAANTWTVAGTQS